MKQYTSYIGAEVNQDDLEIIDKASEIDGRTRASLVRKATIDFARKIIGDKNGTSKMD